MEVPSGSPHWLEAFTAAERPELWQLAREEPAFADLWPEYNLHGNNTGSYFRSLFPAHASLQVLFVDKRADQLCARGRTIPLRWDGTLADLPPGIDAAGRRAVEEGSRPTALCALAAEVRLDHQGLGLGALVLQAMSVVARENGLDPLLAPVRPSWKDRYPLEPIGLYAAWRRGDGLPFDPWMRTHARLGAYILRPEPRSLEIRASLADWQTWTSTAFHSDGCHLFPACLAPLEVSGDLGEYFEPNVWMLHRT